ncbi:uncharacterized protein LOC122073865 isoform X2 [Macadamia integrifolia]|uniref:uncharacterized protein LOC122073865 isoform X2 n=1 Tax=Macadamia integrifolia TaxID=60698 RepID=UPI001C4F16E2|nr:uncharacterized protein LOC122073865 isoform X2 [Macadamia integrifolia]
MAKPVYTVNALRILFVVLGCLMLGILIYTLSTNGSPFRRELFTPWMTATLVDFYINVIALAAWVAYKEPNWISGAIWIILLVCFGSIATCAYVVLQLFKISSQDPLQDPLYHVLLRHWNKNDVERHKTISFVVVARVFFSALGCMMLGTLICTIMIDGLPFRKELLTPWMEATLVDFYINVVAIAVWIAYKESSWVTALLWIVLLICFGSLTTCAFIVLQLAHLSSQDPLYLVLLNDHSSYHQA